MHFYCRVEFQIAISGVLINILDSEKLIITVAKKLKVYEAQVVRVIMYNASSWAAPKAVSAKLDIWLFYSAKNCL